MMSHDLLVQMAYWDQIKSNVVINTAKNWDDYQ